MASPAPTPDEGSRTLGIVLTISILGLGAGFALVQFAVLPALIVPPPPAPKFNATVTIVEGSYSRDNQQFFVPDKVTVVLGFNNTVVWVNKDTVAHSATIDPGGGPEFFDTRLLLPGEKGKLTFTKPGLYKYHCTPHPQWMRASVQVLAPPAPAQK